MGIDRRAWAAVFTAIACGCGGEIDGSTTVVAGDGKPHVIADVYGPSAPRSTAPAGDWTLYELDDARGLVGTLLHFLAGGQLGVTSIDSKTITDDERGDREVPVVPTAWVGPKGARHDCTIANRWRMVDDHHLGVLFTCDDGLGREAVFGFPASSPPFPPPPDSSGMFELTFDSLGGEVGATMAPIPAGSRVIRIGLRRATE